MLTNLVCLYELNPELAEETIALASNRQASRLLNKLNERQDQINEETVMGLFELFYARLGNITLC